jgi:hypothetical protein
MMECAINVFVILSVYQVKRLLTICLCNPTYLICGAQVSIRHFFVMTTSSLLQLQKTSTMILVRQCDRNFSQVDYKPV